MILETSHLFLPTTSRSRLLRASAEATSSRPSHHHNLNSSNHNKHNSSNPLEVLNSPNSSNNLPVDSVTLPLFLPLLLPISPLSICSVPLLSKLVDFKPHSRVITATTTTTATAATHGLRSVTRQPATSPLLNQHQLDSPQPPRQERMIFGVRILILSVLMDWDKFRPTKKRYASL